MSGQAIQNSMTNKKRPYNNKNNKRDFAVFVFVCGIRFKVPSHVCENEYKPDKFVFFSCYFARCRICDRFYV